MPETVGVLMTRPDVQGGLLPTITYRDDPTWRDRKNIAAREAQAKNTEHLVAVRRQWEEARKRRVTLVSGPTWFMILLTWLGCSKVEILPERVGFLESLKRES